MGSLGQVAYEAYATARNWRSVSDATLPQWDDQGGELRDAWEVAARAVANTVQVEGDPPADGGDRG